MAKIKILVAAIGKISGQPLQMAASEYERRLPHVKVVEIDIRKKLPPPEMQKLEGEELLTATKDYYRVALDARGQSMSSEKFAETLQSWHDNHGAVAFLIGGADGHNTEVKSACQQQLSFGPMILPHLLARVVLLEQLYRAETILTKHPYHRG